MDAQDGKDAEEMARLLMGKLTPTERKRAIILQKIHRKYGIAGLEYAHPLITDPVRDSADLDEEAFLAQVDSYFA